MSEGGVPPDGTDAEADAGRTPLCNARNAFYVAPTFPVPESVYQLAAADIDGDGDEDLITLYTDTVGAIDRNAKVRLLMNEGGGNFIPGAAYEVPAGPDLLRVGNLDANPLPDVVISGGSNDLNISLFLNPGAGFTPPVTVPGKATHIELGDMNGDGTLDIIAARYAELVVLLSQGDGSFSFPKGVYAIGNFPLGLAVADFDGDGESDVALSDSQTTLRVLRGLGGGVLEPAFTYGTEGHLGAIAADFTGDGKPDMALHDLAGMVLMVNNGDGTFADPAPKQPVQALNPVDFNGDGKMDLAVDADFQLGILLGDGNGNFTGRTDRTYGRTSSGPVTPIDFDGDGRVDIAAGAEGANETGSVVLYRNLGNGAFAGNFDYSLRYLVFAIGDVNADGSLDLVTSDGNGEGTIVHSLMNEGGGTFAAPADELGGTNIPGSLSLGDLNSDGRNDIVELSGKKPHGSPPDSGQGIVGVLLSNPTGFAPAVSYPGSIGTSETFIGQFDADGAQDVLAGGATSSGTYLLLNQGNGALASPVPVPASNVAGAADLDGDADFDLVIAGPQIAPAVRKNRGNGTFDDAVPLPQLPRLDWRFISTVIQDFDHDGRLDILMASGGPALFGDPTASIDEDFGVSIFFNLGDGTFSRPVVTESALPRGSASFSVVAGDFDGDTHPDVAVGELTIISSSARTNLHVFWNRGDGRFLPPSAFGSLLGTSARLGAADLDRDGQCDLIVEAGDRIRVLLARKQCRP